MTSCQGGKGDGNDGEPDARRKTGIGKKKSQKWLDLKICGWLELRIFNLTHQKRLEAKVNPRGHFKNMSK